MEFHERLQELRKQKGLTQEELAAALYVSRTAVSKWESGRGYPTIDSLKAIAAYFSVSIDALLSGEEALSAAEEEQREKSARLRRRLFRLLDCSAALLLILPLFAQRHDGTVTAVSLTALQSGAPWLRMASFAFVAASVVWGVLSLILPQLGKGREAISFLIHALGALLLIVSLHPYAAALVVTALVLKGLMAANMA